MTIGLDDYVFQLGDDGIPLNDDGSPFIDILSVIGLDSPQFREAIRDHEGTDGGFIDAEFEKGREIILTGVAYSDSGTLESYLDDIKENFAPVTTPIPFYLKAPGVVERLIFVKSRGARYDWTAARRIGVTDIQFLMFAEDPRIYSAELINNIFNYGGDAGIGLSFGTSSVWDTFNNRTLSDSLGTAQSGQSWSTSGGAAADYDVNGSAATIAQPDVSVNRFGLVGASNVADSMILALWTVPATATGGSYFIEILSRVNTVSNFYAAGFGADTAGTIDTFIEERVAGAFTTLVSANNLFAYSPGHVIAIKFKTSGQGLHAKIWNVTTGSEPANWTIETTDASHTTGTFGFLTARASGNTNVGLVLPLDNFTATGGGVGFNIDFGGGATPGGGILSNNGNRPAPVEFIITGPVINPIVRNNTTGQTLSFFIELLGGETLTINTRDRTVYLNGDINRRSTLQTAQWIMLQPGNNDIFYGGLTGASSTLEINYRHAWR